MADGWSLRSVHTAVEATAPYAIVIGIILLMHFPAIKRPCVSGTPRDLPPCSGLEHAESSGVAAAVTRGSPTGLESSGRGRRSNNSAGRRQISRLDSAVSGLDGDRRSSAGARGSGGGGKGARASGSGSGGGGGGGGGVGFLGALKGSLSLRGASRRGRSLSGGVRGVDNTRNATSYSGSPVGHTACCEVSMQRAGLHSYGSMQVLSTVCPLQSYQHPASAACHTLHNIQPGC